MAPSAGNRLYQETHMKTVGNLYLAALALVGLSAPIAAYTGYYAPICAHAMAWTLTGYHTQYVCY
jgi:hypothetical protein